MPNQRADPVFFFEFCKTAELHAGGAKIAAVLMLHGEMVFKLFFDFAVVLRCPEGTFQPRPETHVAPALYGPEHLRDSRGYGFPALFGFGETLATLGCEFIEPGPPAGFGGAPLGFE